MVPLCLLNAAGRKGDWSLFAQLCTTVSVSVPPNLFAATSAKSVNTQACQSIKQIQ